MWTHFHNWSNVRRLCEEKIVRHTEQGDRPGHDTCPIHMHKIGTDLAWPETEEDDQGEIANGDDVVGHTPRPC